MGRPPTRDAEDGLGKSPEPLPGRRSHRGAINLAVNKADTAITTLKAVPRRSPSVGVVERKWQERCEAARSKAMRYMTEAGIMGTRWVLVWESHSDASTNRALTELQTRVFRADDPDYQFFSVRIAKQIFVAAFPREDWSDEQREFHTNEVDPAIKRALARKGLK